MVDEIVVRPTGGQVRQNGWATKMLCDEMDNDQMTGYRCGYHDADRQKNTWKEICDDLDVTSTARQNII